MGFSAVTRLRRIPTASAHAYFSSCSRRAANSPSAPLLMLPPAAGGEGNTAYSFRCLAEQEKFSREYETGGGGGDSKFVGSSHGWLALYNRRNHDLFLSNPITERLVKLPPLPSVERVVLSSDPDEESSCIAFKSGLDGRLALCSPRRREWTVFGGDHVYDNLVYSSAHRRLLCVTWRSTVLESWDVGGGGGGAPRLDSAIEHDMETNSVSSSYDWPGRLELKRQCCQLKYLACAEDSGEPLLVVRHVNLRMGPHGSVVDKTIMSSYGGCHYIRAPYKTVDFDVYRIRWESGELIHMADSLGGLAVFLGTNHPLAIPAAAAKAAGVRPDCIYFTDENRLVEPTRLERTNYGGHDNGIFDYRNKDFYPCSTFYPIEYDKIRKVLPLPLWFTPR